MPTLSYTSVARILSINPAVGSVTTLSSASLVVFAQDAEAQINASLGKLFAVPIAGEPPLLAAIATDIALYRIFTRRILSGESANDSPWPDRYKESLEALEALASGKLALFTSSGTAITATPGDSGMPWTNTQDYNSTFTEDAPESSFIDETKLDYIRDARD